MSNNYQKYLRTSYGRDLTQQHSLSEVGLWRINGEDPNCDLGGYHTMPDLGCAEGTLESVIQYAVELPKFWQWGSGGRITKVQAIKVDAASLKRVAVLKDERTILQSKINKINEELATLGVQS